MSTHAPPKKEGGPPTALKIAQLFAAYRLLAILQAPFGFAFWLIEQRKARLQDDLANKGVWP